MELSSPKTRKISYIFPKRKFPTFWEMESSKKKIYISGGIFQALKIMKLALKMFLIF